MRARLARAATTSARELGIPLVATGDVHMHVRRRRALQDTLTAIRHHCTVAEAGARLFPNGERHLRTREALAAIYPRALLDETRAHRRTLPLRPRASCATTTRANWCPTGTRRPAGCAS